MSAARILKEALALPHSEREELAAKLVDSLDASQIVPGVLGPDDMGEIRRRAAEVRSGAKGVPLDEVHARLFSK